MDKTAAESNLKAERHRNLKIWQEQKRNRPNAATAFEVESSAMHGDCGFWHDRPKRPGCSIAQMPDYKET